MSIQIWEALSRLPSYFLIFQAGTVRDDSRPAVSSIMLQKWRRHSPFWFLVISHLRSALLKPCSAAGTNVDSKARNSRARKSSGLRLTHWSNTIPYQRLAQASSELAGWGFLQGGDIVEAKKQTNPCLHFRRQRRSISPTPIQNASQQNEV